MGRANVSVAAEPAAANLVPDDDRRRTRDDARATRVRGPLRWHRDPSPDPRRIDRGHHLRHLPPDHRRGGESILSEESDTARYAGVLGVSHDPLVSSDIVGDPRASIVDLELTKVVDGDLVKVMSWYDNEWGYANQMLREAISVTRGQTPRTHD